MFNRDTVPPALCSAHSVKAGVWGLLCVLRGRLRYCLDNGGNGAALLVAGEAAVIEPQVPHHVELLDDDTTFQVEFHRAEVSP